MSIVVVIEALDDTNRRNLDSRRVPLVYPRRLRAQVIPALSVLNTVLRMHPLLERSDVTTV